MRIIRVGAILLLLWLVITVPAYADEGIHIVCPETVHPREIFDVQLWVDREDVTKVTFELDYDREHLQLQHLSPYDETAWKLVPVMQGHAYERIKPSQAPQQATFRIRFLLKTADAGAVFWVRLKNVVLWVGDTQYPMGDMYWEETVAHVVSDDNYLSALQLSDCVLSPEFSPYQQNYSATVSHHVAQVSVAATPNNVGAVVQVDAPELEYGKTTNVTVTVTAEDGSVRIYTIAVTREDAPDRIPGSNCDLESLVVTDYRLSPVFQPEVTEYVLWLPYETASLEIIATPADGRAAVSIVGNKGLKAGQDNPVLVTCTAEDGTQKCYTILAKRAEPYVPTPTQAGENPIPAGDGAVYTAAENVPVWVYVVVAVAAVTGCAAVGILVADRKK